MNTTTPPSSTGLFMQQALALAEMSIGLSDPNPRVGCIITTPDGRLIGSGHTQRAGGPHAEVMALRDAQAQGHSVRGATAYVTLEPCAHHGRTPPCCDALIQAGVGRVVVAVGDPNPLVAGQGLSRMRSAGIQVEELAPSPLQEAARELNIGFFSRMQRQRPWVRLKVAVSLDGRTALPNGKSQWLTGTSARTDGHAWRKRAGAVLTGMGTLLADDPRLDVRLVPTDVQPMRVVLDSQLRTPVSAQLFETSGRVLVYTTCDQPEKARTLEAKGAEVQRLPQAEDAHHLNLHAVLTDLAARGVNELHVEAGESLNGAFIRGGWVDEYLMYVAPVLIGAGRGLSDLGPFTDLKEAQRLKFHDITRIGDDLRILARPSP